MARKKAPELCSECGRPVGEPPSELEDLERLRIVLWRHLEEETPGKQKLGVGAIGGQLAKVIERIQELKAEGTKKEVTIADALAEARERRANGQARTSRRGTKSAR